MQAVRTIEIRQTNGVRIFVPMGDVNTLRETIAVARFLSVPARRDDGISIHHDDINDTCEIHCADSIAEDATLWSGRHIGRSTFVGSRSVSPRELMDSQM